MSPFNDREFPRHLKRAVEIRKLLTRELAVVQACLKTGATCIIDIHNYARWNGQIIGQGGPTNDQFVNLWTQVATKYKSQSMIAFGVMNEPHEVDINKVSPF
jgi:aryl-phospho-beta-D-glucosidase BglC (GH1 family)